jgi:prolyl oligopeptidase
MFKNISWKKTVAAGLLLSGTIPALHAQMLAYPQARKANVVDNYFGTRVADPYRWLENDTAAEVKDWVQKENTVTQQYLSQIPYRAAIRKRMADLYNFPRVTAPLAKGGKYYFYKNDGLQNQNVLYVEDKLDGTNAHVFLDPNTLSKDGTVALGSTAFSKDGQKMAYIINRSGSDWQEIYVVDATTGKRTTDSIRWAKFTDIAWQGNGFYYARFDEPKKGSELVSQNEYQKIYYHKLGSAQSEDKLVFADNANPKYGYGASTTDDESMIMIYGSEGSSSGNSLLYSKLSPDGVPANFKKLFDGFDHSYTVIDNVGDKLLVRTDKGAPRYRLVLIDPNKPEEKNWKVIIPEKPEVLQNVTTAGGKLFAHYMKDATAHVYQYDMNGKLEHEINLPTLGTESGFAGKKEDKDVFYSFTSFTYPTTIFKYNIATGKSEVFSKSEAKFNPEDYEVKQVFYKSKDGTKVPMFIVHKKGIKLDGNNPTFLYAYGGFDISLYPDFSITRMILLENGGIYAVANLRGGGEYGEEWHKAGMLNKKQNVFDDFISAAQYLIDNKYTSPQKLAIHGRSNGGLLIGACMTQKPDLYKVAFPGVGVLDMLRYHKFTIGYAWASEYGSSDDSAQFSNLYKFSPLHNLKAGVNYPATMVTTADHDDRVVPAHSFKFAATLQEKYNGSNPVLIRIDSKAGHGAGKPIGKQLDEWADIWSFMFWNMGVTPKYN